MSLNTPPSDDQLQFIQLRSEGKTLRDCARQMQKPLSTLGDWNQTFQSIIQPLHHEFLKAQHNITLENTLGRYQQLLDKLEKALDDRAIGFMNTKSTCDLYLKIIDCQHKLVKP